MTPDELKAELSKMSSDALGQVVSSLHELKDAGMIEMGRDILWSRHAVPGRWPEKIAITAARPAVIEQAGKISELETWLIAYCAAGPSPVGSSGQITHASGHAAKRTLFFVASGPYGTHEFSGTECECGRRSDRPFDDQRYLEMRWYRLVPTPRVWPVVTDESRNGGYPCFQVCRKALTADDQAHGPNVSDKCLCGEGLGMCYDHKAGSYVCRDQFFSCQ